MEAIHSYENGVLTEVDDINALVKGAEWVLSLNDSDWKKLSLNAYETLAESSWEHSTMFFEQALHHAIDKSKQN